MHTRDNKEVVGNRWKRPTLELQKSPRYDGVPFQERLIGRVLSRDVEHYYPQLLRTSEALSHWIICSHLFSASYVPIFPPRVLCFLLFLSSHLVLDVHKLDIWIWISCYCLWLNLMVERWGWAKVSYFNRVLTLIWEIICCICLSNTTQTWHRVMFYKNEKNQTRLR